MTRNRRRRRPRVATRRARERGA